MRQAIVILLVLISIYAETANAQPPQAPGNAAAIESWWSETDAGWIGGGLGGAVGILGAVFGISAGLGLARRFVLSFALALLALGVLFLVSGIIAVSSGQPYHVFYPLLLVGGILTFVIGLNFVFLKRRYEQLELQRMSAMDA